MIQLTTYPLTAEDWPQSRGPTGLGHTPVKNLTIKWGGNENENIFPERAADRFPQDQVRRAIRSNASLTFAGSPNAVNRT
jgi:hypothetical protein